MSEQITAEVISGRNPVAINVNKSTPLGGGNEVKNVLEGTVGNKEISLVEREFDERYVSNWQVFKDAGLPVVPTLRKSSKGTLLVTDIKADGSEIYGKGLSHALHKPMETRERPRPEIDSVFLQLTDSVGFSAVENKAKEYVAIADSNKIRLPYDDAFEMVVHPDGSWNLITLDLRYAEKFGENSNPLHVDEAVQRNQQAANTFLSQLRQIRTQLEMQNKPKGLLKFLGRFRKS